MLLILTNSQDATADHLVHALSGHSVRFVRLDTDSSPTDMQVGFRDGDLLWTMNARRYRPSDFTNVWYRRPEPLKHQSIDDSPEGKFVAGEWSEALESFLALIDTDRWMNHPVSNATASHKIEQLVTAKTLGFTVPHTLVTQDAEELRRFYRENAGRIIVKPMARGYVSREEPERDSLVYTNALNAGDLVDLEDLPACPTLFQEWIDKAIDVRITVVDEDIHAVGLIAREPDGSQRCDIRRNNMEDVEYSLVRLPETIDRQIRALVQRYRLRFAAIDMAIGTNGIWYFFEVNPNGQWAWLDETGVTSIAASFVRVFRG